jgi:hypothetical protein
MGILDFLRGNKTPQPAMAQQAPTARPARQGFGFNARSLAYLLSPDAAYEGEQRRFELDQRQEAMDTARQNAEAKRRKAELDARIGATLYGMPQGYGAQNMPAIAPEAPRVGDQADPAPMPSQGAPIPQEAPQPAQISPTTGLPMVQEQAVVTGRVRRPAPPAPEPADMAAAFEDAARQYAGAGFVEDANAAWKQAQELRARAQSASQGQDQVLASLLAPIASTRADSADATDALGWDQNQQDAIRFALDDYARRTGRDVPAELEDRLLSPDPRLRRLAMQQIIGASSPEDAAKGSIGVTNDEAKQINEQRYAPAQILDLGSTKKTLRGDGREIGSYKVNASPNAVLGAETQRRGQDISARTAQLQSAAQTERTRIQASVTMSEGEKNRALRNVDLQLKRRMLELGLPEGAPVEPSQYGAIIWDNGG